MVCSLYYDNFPKIRFEKNHDISLCLQYLNISMYLNISQNSCQYTAFQTNGWHDSGYVHFLYSLWSEHTTKKEPIVQVWVLIIAGWVGDSFLKHNTNGNQWHLDPMLVTWFVLKIHVYEYVNVYECTYACYFGLLRRCLGLKTGHIAVISVPRCILSDRVTINFSWLKWHVCKLKRPGCCTEINNRKCFITIS